MWLEKGRISRQAFHILDDELAGSCCSAAGQNVYFEENLKEEKKKLVVWRIRGHLFYREWCGQGSVRLFPTLYCYG